MIDNKILITINNEILHIVRNFVVSNKILDTKYVSDVAFSRDNMNVSVNTGLSNINDTLQLISDNVSKYEDDQYNYKKNELYDGKGVIGVDTLITIDSGNNSTGQMALNNNGYLSLEIYNYLKRVTLPVNWLLYEINMDVPTWFPAHSQNIYTIIEIRGLYAIQ
jgi:hypothetical protein